MNAGNDKGKILRYRIPIQSSMDDIFYQETLEQSTLSNVDLQFRIDTFLRKHDIDPCEQYPHMIGRYIKEKPYTLYSEFDADLHKQNFINYLEVCIDKHGTVHYAVPSHQEFLIRAAMDAKGWTRQELEDACPREYYGDYMTWLSIQSETLAVWGDWFCGVMNKSQLKTLKYLRLKGLYAGPIPDTSQYEIWSEGYCATGYSQKASYHGTSDGVDFRCACMAFFKNSAMQKHFNPVTLSVWGCKLYDNETDARKNFG